MLRASYFTLFICLLLGWVTSSYNATGAVYKNQIICAPENCVLSAGNLQLVLVGVVLDEATMQPLENMTVKLTDNFSKQTEITLSSRTGNFYFPLLADKIYTVQLLMTNGALLCSKEISTVNRLQPEILRVMFPVPATK